MIMKSAKIQCNRVIAEAKKSHWTEFCKSEVLESKDMYKVWKNVKEMKNGYKLQAYSIKLENNNFPGKIVYHQISIHRLSNLERKKNKKKTTRTQFQTSVIT